MACLETPSIRRWRSSRGGFWMDIQRGMDRAAAESRRKPRRSTPARSIPRCMSIQNPPRELRQRRMEGVSRQANYRSVPERRLTAFRVLRASDELVTSKGGTCQSRRIPPRDLPRDSVGGPEAAAAARGRHPRPCPELPRAPGTRGVPASVSRGCPKESVRRPPPFSAWSLKSPCLHLISLVASKMLRPETVPEVR